MKYYSGIIFLFFILILFFYFNYNRILKKSGFFMDTVWEIKIYGGKEEYINDCIELMKRFEEEFSFFDSRSCIYKLNKFKVIKDFSKDFYEIIKDAKYFYEYTNGYFDPSIKPLLNAYGFYSGNYRIPSDKEIQKIIDDSVGFDISISTFEIRLNNIHQEIDVGALLKGYVVDKISEYLKSKKLKGFLVNIGGEVYAYGKKGIEKWVIGLKDPDNGGILKMFYVKNGAVATSGDYERFFIKNGLRISHLLSPKTGKNPEYIRSVSVFSESCKKADILATSIFVMDKKGAINFIKKHNIDAVLIYKNGKIEKFGNFPDFL